LTGKNVSLTTERTIEELEKCGITHVVCLPDSASLFLYNAIKRKPEFTLVPVCREGEAIAIAAGLLLGGKQPIVMHQNTDFFESGDSVRGLALDLALPIVLMISYRGWRHGSPMTDSAGNFLEPILDAWGIKHYMVESDEDVEKISLAFKETHQTKKPVAILIGKEYEISRFRAALQSSSPSV